MSDNILKRIFDWFSASRKGPQPAVAPKNGSAQTDLLPSIVRMLNKTHDVEISCDDVFLLLDQYTELACQGEDLSKLMPLVDQHIEMCPDCREEFEALRRIIQSSISPERGA